MGLSQAQGYLAYLTNTLEDKVKVEYVPIVKDYPDIFIEKFPKEM